MKTIGSSSCLAALLLLSCQSAPPVGVSSAEPTARPLTPVDAGEKRTALTCTRHHRAPSTETTEYTCPDEASLARCQSADVIGCTPTNRERGTVPPGGKCTREAWSPEGKRYELGDSCAPAPKFVTAQKPQGSVCVMESGVGAYCTHDCAAPADCADLVREGFFAECSGGGCLLTRK